MPALPLNVLDVNKTLLDFQAMEPIFERNFGDECNMGLWFLGFSLTDNLLEVQTRQLGRGGIDDFFRKTLERGWRQAP
jgi:hypothetical protein